MPEVESSAIREVRYNPQKLELVVTFVHSGVYVYYGVPRQEYERMLEAPSIGAFYNENIKYRYRWRKL